MSTVGLASATVVSLASMVSGVSTCFSTVVSVAGTSSSPGIAKAGTGVTCSGSEGFSSCFGGSVVASGVSGCGDNLSISSATDVTVVSLASLVSGVTSCFSTVVSVAGLSSIFRVLASVSAAATGSGPKGFASGFSTCLRRLVIAVGLPFGCAAS